MTEHLSYNRIYAKWQDTKQGTKCWVCLSKAQAAVEERGKKMERERERKRGRGREREREMKGRNTNKLIFTLSAGTWIFHSTQFYYEGSAKNKCKSKHTEACFSLLIEICMKINKKYSLFCACMLVLEERITIFIRILV